MINRKEKSIQHLYKVTNKLARPRKTSILEGDCQMRGPVDESDLEVVTDFLSKNVNKCGSGCSSGHSDGNCRDTMALNNDDAVNSFDSPDSRDFKMSSTGKAAEKGFVDSGIGEKSSSRGLTENGESLLDVVKRKHDHVKRPRATKSMGEIANNGTDISQKTSKSQGDDMTNETVKSLKTKLASEPSSEIASKMHDLHTGVKNGGHLSSRETKAASEVVAPDDLDKDILRSNEESRSKTLDSDNSMTERDHFNSRRYITNKVSGRRIDLSIDVKAESSVKADPDTEYVANTDSTRQRSIKATEMPGAKDTLSLDPQAKLNVNVHCSLPKTFEVLEKHTGDTSCRSACKKGMQLTDGDSKDQEDYHSKSAEFFIKDEKHITNMTTEQGVPSIDLKNMQSSSSKNMMDTMKSVKNIPEQRKISIPEDDKASKDSPRLTNMTNANTNPSTRECVDVITPEPIQLIASSSTLDVNSSNSSVAKPASSGIFQHQISEAVSPSSTVMVGKIVDTLDPRFNQKRNTDNLHAVPSNPTASVNATTQLAMPSGDKSPKVAQNECLTPHSKILSPRRLDSGVTENQCLINKTLITQESFKQSSHNGNPQDGAGSGTENEKRIDQTESSLAVPEPAVEENSNDFGVIEDDVKVCDICGDAGQEEKLAVCSLCNDGAEHIYCMRIMLDKVPDGDWFCEECKLNKSISPNKSIPQSIKAFKQEPSIVKKQNIDSNLSYRGAPSKVDRKSLLKRLVKGISQPQLSLKSTMKRSIEDSEPLPAAKKQAIDIRATQNATSTTPRAVLSRDNSFKADASKAKPLTPSALTGNKFSNAYSSNKLAAVPSTSSKPHGTSLATKNKHGSTNIFNTSEAARLGRTNSNVKTSGISVATADRVAMLSRSSDAALHSPTSRFSNSPKTASIVRGMKDSVEAGQPSEKREIAGNGQVMAGVNKIFGKSHSFKSLGTSNSYSIKESRSISDSHNTGILSKGNPVARTKKDFDPQFWKSEKISNELAVSCGATPACTETSNSDSNSSQSNSKATSTRKEFGRSISITGRKSTDAFFGNTKSVGTASLAVASPETSETDSKSLKPSLPTASATSSLNVSEKLCNDSRKSSVVEASNKDVSVLVDNRISTTPSPKVGETGSTSSDNPRNDECIKKTKSTCSLPLETSNALSDDLHMSSVVSKATKGLIGSHQSIPLTAENSNEAKTSIEIHPVTCNKEELAIKMGSSAQSVTQCEGEKLMNSSLLVGVGETKISESENPVEEIPANCSVSYVSGGAITSMRLGKNEELSSGTKISSQKMLLDEDLVSSQDVCRIKTSNSGFTIYPTESTVTAVRRDIPCGIAVVKDGVSAGNSSGIVPVESTKRFASPDHNFLWQGAFEIKSKGDLSIFVGLQAHASTCAAPKVLDATKKFPSHISLEEAPRLSSWPKQFQCTRPNDENIALYFFAKDLDSYERSYRKLLDHMLKNDYALRGNVDGVDLLIFPSNQLPEQSQRWNRLLYLWGVFRERKAGCVENFNALEKIPGQFFSSGLNTANLNAKHPGSFSLSLSTPGSSQPSKADCDSRGIHAALRDKSLHKGEKAYLDRSFSLPSSSFQGEQEAMNSMAKLSDQRLQAGLATISEQIPRLPIEYSLSQNDGKRPIDEMSDRQTVSQTETAETEQHVERNAEEIGSDKDWMTLSRKIENHSSDNLQDPKDSGHELHHYHSHSPPHHPSSLSLFSVKDQSLSQACARDIFQPQPLQSTSASELHGIHSNEITSQRKRLFNGFIADDKELKRLRKSYSEINVRDGFNQDWNFRNTSDKSSSELNIYSNNQQPTSSAHPFESSSSKHDEIGASDQLRKTEQFFYPGLSVAENEDQALFQQSVISYSQSKPVDHKFAQNIDDDPPVSMDIDMPNLELALGAKANCDKLVQPNAATVDRNTHLKPISKSISEDGSSLSLSLSISTSEKDSVNSSQAEKKALTEGVTPVLLFGGRLKG